MSENQKILWDDRYCVGIEMIDTQHKKLFDLVNRLYDLDDKNTKDDLRVILYEFSEYMSTHFKEEEEYMVEIGFPEAQYHKQLHQDLVDQLSQVIKTPARLEIIKTKMKILAKRILIDHITHEDTKIKLYELSLESANEKVFDITDL